MSAGDAIPLDTLADRTARLTSRQRQCLALVARHLSSKEIGDELGISHHTVDHALKGAMQLLGVQTRTQAARVYISASSPMVGSQSSELAIAPQSHATTAPAEQQPFTLVLPPPPLRRGRLNDLTATQRLGWSATIALAIFLAIFLAIAASESLSRHLGRSSSPQHTTIN